jgi:hypothetical protein
MNAQNKDSITYFFNLTASDLADRFPVTLNRGDSLAIKAGSVAIEFTVAEPVRFYNCRDVNIFLNDSVEVEWVEPQGWLGIRTKKRKGLVRTANARV